MPLARERGTRPVVASLLVFLAAGAAVAGCSTSSATTPAAAPLSVKPTATTSVDPAARSVVNLAARATAAETSYAFVSDARVATTRTHLVGQLVRGEGLAYTLTVGGHRTQVVRLSRATYVRAVPGRWARLAKPRHLLDPTATLLTVLRRMTAAQLSQRGHLRVVTGALPTVDAAAAGLPSLTQPARVVVSVGRAGDVVALRVTATTSVSGRDVDVVVTTSYADFGNVARIRRPA